MSPDVIEEIAPAPVVQRTVLPPGPRRSLTVVVPCYNEAARLPGTLRGIHNYLNREIQDAELIVVDDGSSDSTLEILDRLRPTLPLLKVISYARNRGKGFAVRTGILEATKEAVLFCDADQSTPISELGRFWPSLDDGASVIIASRYSRRSVISVPQPFHRRLLGKIFRMLVSLLGVRGLADTQCGFKLFRADDARTLFSRLATDGFSFDVEVLLRARRLGLRVRQVAVRWDHSDDSRIRVCRDPLRMLLELVKIWKAS